MANPTKTLSVGSNLNALDVYLNVDGVAINASGISFYVYDAIDEVAASGVPTNPEMGHYVGSGIIPGNHALGSWYINWHIISTGGAEFIVSEPFFVQAMNISFTLDAPNEIITTIYSMVRDDIGDSDGLIFVDSYLRNILLKAVVRLNNKLGLATTPLTVMNGIPGNFGGIRIQPLQIILNLDNGTISPPGETYQDLLILQMEQIIITSEISALKRMNASASSGPAAEGMLTALNDGVMVRSADGTVVDVSVGRLQSRTTLYKFDADRINKELNDAVKVFLSRISGRFGKCVY